MQAQRQHGQQPAHAQLREVLNGLVLDLAGQVTHATLGPRVRAPRPAGLRPG